MLRIEETTNRTYQERMDDAFASLPLISGEWTNFNPSDPGMTILENLTVFETLQGSRINALTDRVQFMLLKMAGFQSSKGKCARVLLTTDGIPEKIQVIKNQKFRLGRLVFETRRDTSIGGCHLTGILSSYNDSYHDCSFLLDREYRMPVRIFGDTPKVGDCVYFFSNDLPEPGAELIFYINVDSRFNRNPVENRAENLFASLKWEYYTEEGFQELKVRDYTGAFISSGELKLKLGEKEPSPYRETPVKGYCIRATLTEMNYDIRPRLTAVDAFLLETWQKDTKAVCTAYRYSDKLHIKSLFPEGEYVLVFGKEEKGPSYRRYELTLSPGARGRYCLYKKEDKGFTLEFGDGLFGKSPVKVKEAIRVVLYDEDIMRSYRIGLVQGYDNQELDLPVKHIVPDSFCLLAKRQDESGEDIFDFVRPEHNEDDSLYYHLLENDGKIVIEDAGSFMGAELFLSGVTVSEGPDGNVRPGNYFSADGLDYGAVFYNPGGGTGGCFRERLEEVRDRFRNDVFTPYTCVTAADYEEMVRTTPGLCIRKAKAIMNEMDNLVHIAVMPGTDEEHPSLPDTYKKAITERLLERRLITTRFQLLNPVYTPVSIKSTVYVRRYVGDCRKIIEERFRKELDYVESDRNFGEILRFEDVFRAVEELDCVEYIYELSVWPERRKFAKVVDSDIYPLENCLLYPGNIELELITAQK
ncbi:MAG: hypothetical protein K5989_05005 [Lachnospiraceae bacterium]|nr:hypothetical protein [Lachnospiraceae bacterium]